MLDGSLLIPITQASVMRRLHAAVTFGAAMHMKRITVLYHLPAVVTLMLPRCFLWFVG